MLRLFMAVSMLLFFITNGVSQTRKERRAAEEARIKQLIESQDYVFLARMVNPPGGRTRQVTNDYYTVRVTKDSVLSDLPYFGRAYTAPIGASSGGIRFTSTSFEYRSEPAKKDGWVITIMPRDVSDTRQITLNVGSRGTTTATVVSNNRQTISFTGVIEEKKSR